MLAVCRALKPPATKSTAATAPIMVPQNTRKRFGGSSLPIDRMVVSTKVLESDEVINQLNSKKDHHGIEYPTPDPATGNAIGRGKQRGRQVPTID